LNVTDVLLALLALVIAISSLARHLFQEEEEEATQHP